MQTKNATQAIYSKFHQLRETQCNETCKVIFLMLDVFKKLLISSRVAVVLAANMNGDLLV